MSGVDERVEAVRMWLDWVPDGHALASHADLDALAAAVADAEQRADDAEKALDEARGAVGAHNWRRRAETSEGLAESYDEALELHKRRIRALQEALCECEYREFFQADLHAETCPVFIVAANLLLGLLGTQRRRRERGVG